VASVDFEGAATTFLIPGVASGDHKLLTIFNSDATKKVRVYALTLGVDHTAANTALVVARTFTCTAAPSGGTALTKVRRAGSGSSMANCALLGGASADGTASTITATLVSRVWSQFRPRLHTLVGASPGANYMMLPSICLSAPFVLNQNEGLVIDMVQASATDYRYVCNGVWDEYTP
jgi:hypothetical protein